MVGLPRNMFPLVEELVERTPWFEQQLDVYRLAISLAVAHRWTSGVTETAGFDTKFSVSSLDPDDRLKDMILAFSDSGSEGTYDFAQRLAIPGINYLHRELVLEGKALAEVLGIINQETEETHAGANDPE